MTEFWQALGDPDIRFLRYTLIIGLMASLAFGVVGSYVVVHRITAIAGAIAHCVLAGIGAALYSQRALGWEWFHPMFGALAAALVAAYLLGLVSLHAKEREDTAIGALWAIGMAIGLLFLARTPGYVDPMSYLFGNILIIGDREIWIVAALDVLVLGVVFANYRRFQALCFDPEFARLRGLSVERYYLLLLCLVALTVVLLVHVVGIVLAIALLSIPAAIAGRLVRHLWQMMIVAALLCMVFVVGGLGVSYRWDLPTGPTIALGAGIVYTVVFVIAARRRAGRRGPPTQDVAAGEAGAGSRGA